MKIISFSSESSGVSNLTSAVPHQPDETTPLSFELNSADMITKEPVAHSSIVDVVSKYKKVALIGVVFLILLVCNYTFLLGRQDGSNLLQFDEDKLLSCLEEKDEIMYNTTTEMNNLAKKIEILLDRLDEKDNELSKAIKEKNELMEKATRSKEEIDQLIDENNNVQDRLKSVELENVSLKSKAVPQESTPTRSYWRWGK